ncbi:hypothetical protein HK097_003429 [Rhizophlyctis rosea]|uniref:Tetraspanin n=1 Tax=Rhizophlyctis rosea TaxID=64517 RepID=A0AAD5WZL4_9FUNG|nr:hypothetical protein HK097_003429 [Rhizophlyctis rosea]
MNFPKSGPSFSVAWASARFALVFATFAMAIKTVLLFIASERMKTSQRGVLLVDQSIANGVHAFAIFLVVLLPVPITSAAMSITHNTHRRVPTALYIHLAVMGISLITTVGLAIAAFRDSVEAVHSAETAWRSTWSDASKSQFQTAVKCCGFNGLTDAVVKTGVCAAPTAAAAAGLPGCSSALINTFRGAADEAWSALFASTAGDMIAMAAAVVTLGVWFYKLGDAHHRSSAAVAPKIMTTKEYDTSSKVFTDVERASVAYTTPKRYDLRSLPPGEADEDILYRPPSPPKNPPPHHLTINTSFTSPYGNAVPLDEVYADRPVPPPRVATATTRGLWSAPNLSVKIPSPTLSEFGTKEKEKKTWTKTWDSPTA